MAGAFGTKDEKGVLNPLSFIFHMGMRIIEVCNLPAN
jgi:hypothetical protein